MDNNKFEKEIKDMFNQHQPELDNDVIWENIEPKLKKKKKRRFFFIWFLGAGLSILAYYAFQELGSVNASTLTTAEQTNTSDLKADQTKSLQSTKSTDSENDEMNLSLNNENTTPLRGTKSSTTRDSKPSNLYNNINTSYDKRQSRQTSSNPLTANTTIPAEASNTRLAPKGDETKANEGIQTEVEKNTKIDSPLEVEKILEKAQVKDPTATDDDDDPKIKKKPSKTKPQKDKKKRGWGWNWNKKKKKKRKKRKKKVTPLGKQPFEVQLQTAVAPAIAFKSLKENPSASEASAILAKEKEAHTQLETFSYNLGLHFQHKKSGFLIATALEYRQINERFDHFQIEEKVEFTTGVIEVTENYAEQVIDTKMGLKDIKTTTTTEKKFYNNHRFFSLPIGIGKAWDNRKSGYKFLAGVDINLLYRFKGAIYGEQLEPIKIAKNKNTFRYNQVFKQNAGLGLWVSGEYNRSINPRLSWVVAPKLQIPLSSSMKADYSLSQKHILLQFDLGLNYLLNPKRKKKKKKK